jgi:hypothetical protein
MRLVGAVLLVLASVSVVLVLSNTDSQRYALRLAGWTVLHGTVPTLVVAALFAGAAAAGLPLALANWWLRRRLAHSERQLRAAREESGVRAGPAGEDAPR